MSLFCSPTLKSPINVHGVHTWVAPKGRLVSTIWHLGIGNILFCDTNMARHAAKVVSVTQL